MIDLDKYAGHTPGPWAVCNSSQFMFGRKHGNGTEPLGFVYGPSLPERSEYGRRAMTDARLIAAAPELLDEVKRLRQDLHDTIRESQQYRAERDEVIDALRQMLHKGMIYGRDHWDEVIAARAVLAKHGDDK